MSTSQCQFGTKLPVEKDARLIPLSLYGTFRYLVHGGDLDERETTEEFQVYHVSQGRIHLGQFVQSLADAREFAVLNCILDDVGCDGVISNWPPLLWARRFRV